MFSDSGIKHRGSVSKHAGRGIQVGEGVELVHVANSHVGGTRSTKLPFGQRLHSSMHSIGSVEIGVFSSRNKKLKSNRS